MQHEHEEQERNKDYTSVAVKLEQDSKVSHELDASANIPVSIKSFIFSRDLLRLLKDLPSFVFIQTKQVLRIFDSLPELKFIFHTF